MLGQERCEARRVIETLWRDSPAGRIGDVHEDAGLIGFVRLANDWFDPDDLQQHVAWVVEWMVPGIDVMQRGLVELGEMPASTSDREHDLGAKARAVLVAGPPEAPEAFGFGPTGFETKDQLRGLVSSPALPFKARKRDSSMPFVDPISTQWHTSTSPLSSLPHGGARSTTS